MVRKIWQNFHNDQRGFSFTELLATLIVVSLATALVAAGIPAAHRAYIKMVDSSNSQVLLSTATTRLRDELGFAQSVKVVNNTTVEYVNGKTGRAYRITGGDNGLLRSEKGTTGAWGSGAPLFSEKASTGLTLTFTSVSLPTTREYITFTNVKVTKEGYDSPLATLAEYDIRLNANPDEIS